MAPYQASTAPPVRERKNWHNLKDWKSWCLKNVIKPEKFDKILKDWNGKDLE